MKPLAQPGIDVVRDGRIKFVPERFERIYLNWMENIRDWCISRQLWWGHRIPVWYSADEDGDRIIVTLPRSSTTHGAQPRVGTYNELRAQGVTHEHDPDARHLVRRRGDADRRRSRRRSARRPAAATCCRRTTCSTRGSRPACGRSRRSAGRSETPELTYWYPTSVMETGYDIIFLWVARMIMLGLYNVGEIPYSTRLPARHRAQRARPAHEQVARHRRRPARGRREVRRRRAALHADHVERPRQRPEARRAARRGGAQLREQALERRALRDLDDRRRHGRACRTRMPPADAPLEDRWILSRVEGLARSVDEQMRKFELGEAARQVYEFVWSEFADWYIEIAKVRVRGETATAPSPLPVLAYVLERCLRLLHPVMPFVTEEIWQALAPKIDGIDDGGADRRAVPARRERLPRRRGRARDGDADRRRARDPQHPRREEGRAGASSSRRTSSPTARAALLEAGAPYIEMLARVKPLHIVGDVAEAPREQVATAVLEGVTAVVPLAGLFDVEAERARLRKQIADAEAEAGRIEAKLANEGFRAKAPAKIIAAEEERLAAVRTRLEGLGTSLAELG